MEAPWWNCEHPMTQWVRLFDVAAIGPVMIVSGWLLPKQYKWLAISVASLGALTIAYNARNYLWIRQRGLT